MASRVFSKTMLAKLKANTKINAHGYNLELIAKAIGSDVYPRVKKFNSQHNKKGYLTSKMAESQYKIRKRVMSELKILSPVDYKAVKSVL